ncbi:hypothetical protein H4582DRAFT_1368927 [Lactarius indigo]|nr:hypothetical protein H4582DRAFT_1368927 [Lactarius indigo]
MSTSNNSLLQHLFWHFPPLSPLSRSDAMLLSAAGGGDVIDVDERQDGIGAFVARIQIRRFRLRMRVSKLVKIEFITSDRIWTITFSLGPKNTAIGPSEGEWLLSFGLGDHSMPAWVEWRVSRLEISIRLPIVVMTMNLPSPSLLAVIPASSNRGSKVRSRCAWTTVPCILIYLMGRGHLLTTMEHYMPNSMSSLLNPGGRVYPPLILRTAQV